jgi:hypothetical protein
LIVIVFLSPAYIKYRIGIESDFYFNKRTIHLGIVLGHFSYFKKKYKEIMEVNALQLEEPISAEFTEQFYDPPFNTKKKQRIIGESKDALISHIYNE